MTLIRLRLREATREAHERLEVVMGVAPGLWTVARYGRMLQILHAIRTGWEPGLAVLLPEWGGLHREWLAADLCALALPPIAPAPSLGLAGAKAWGAQYVLEGSALGGRVMLPTTMALGLTETVGARYFAGHGVETGRRWAAFLDCLETAATPEARVAIVEGACQAFQALTSFAADRMA